METPKMVEIKTGEKPMTASAHTEAVALVEKHRDFFEHYAKEKIKIAPAPEGMSTFAFDLETNTIYVNSMFYKKWNLSEEKTVFGTLHEIEHFMEKLQMLSEEGGEKKFDHYLKRIESSAAFDLMDNCVADIRENRAVVSKTNPGMKELEEVMYKNDLFPDTDFTSEPRHIQLCEALLREARVPGEQCNVAGDVRVALNEIAKVEGLVDIMTNPGTPMSLRLKLQERYVWPKVESLLEKDMENKEKKKDQEQQEGKEEKEREGKESEKEKDGPNEKKADRKKDKEDKGGKKTQQEKTKNGEGKENPNVIFTDDYAKAKKRFPDAVPHEEIKKAFEEWKEKQKEKNSSDKADEEYAKKIGVEKKDLQEYRKTAESLEDITNPGTHLSVVGELRNLFSRIIAKRLKTAFAPKYPVEEGEELVDPAQLVADVKSGNLMPKVWEDTEMKVKKGDRFGEVEITLVCDRSSSMTQGQKAPEQRKSAVLMMEALKEFADLCGEEKTNIDKPLEIKSEIYTFASSDEDKSPIKKMSKELGEAERVHVFKKLHSLPGSTTDFACLETIDSNLDDETKKKIKEGELKKIIIVFTDGGSDNVARVQAALKSLRESGIVAVGVGITKDGSPALTTYAPNALVVEDVTKLPLVIFELLKEHLKDI